MASDSAKQYPKVYPEVLETQDYRLKKIADVQTAIETELGHYEQVLKKYKRARGGLTRCSIVAGTWSAILSGGSLASALTGFGIVVGAPMAGVAVLLGTASAGCGVIARRFEGKISKHEQTIATAKAKLSTIVSLISKALDDGKVSHEEFSLINAELEKFRQMKAAIRTKQGAPQEAQPKLSETPAEIEKRVREEMLKKLG